METRKRHGLGLMINGVLFVVAGAVVFGTAITPVWLPVAIQVIGVVSEVLGFKLVYPDHD